MTKKLTPAEGSRKDVIIPRTRGQSEKEKKKGSVLGYLIRQPGRPPGSTSTSTEAAAAASSSSTAAAAAEAGTKRDDVPFGCMTGTQKKKRRKQEYTNWEEYPDILQAYVDMKTKQKQVPLTSVPRPPRTTVNDYLKRLNKHEEATGERITVAEWINQYKKSRGRNPLISQDIRNRIQNIVVVRDGRNNPMTRKHIIEIIESVGQCTKVQATNYYNHCTARKMFPLLKKGGRVCSAQKTTTSRTQVTIEQQYRWHTLIDQVWEKQEETNLPSEEFNPVRAHFQLNLDEECVMGNEGTVKVIASIFGKKVQKNMDDYRGSVTVIRVGSAGGGEGPIIFLCAGKDKYAIPPALRGDLSKKGLPIGSCVVVSPTAYLTDEVWMECVPHICKGIRAMDVIKDHPEWLVCLTLDGFGSHLQAVAYDIFNQYKIQLVVEDGDTSQTNQAFDQQKAKEDKRNIRNLLDSARYTMRVQLDQWSLISVCIVTLKRSTASAWINSFIRVNLHPDHRLSFWDWIKKIESQIVAGESFFKCRTSLYDILPEFWKRMKPADRANVVTIIDGFYASNEPTWSKENINQLLEYVPLNDMVRLRACYWTAKNDDTVIYRVREEVVESSRLLEAEFDEKSLRGVLDKYTWYPQAMDREYGPRRKWDCCIDPKRPPMNDLRRHWSNHLTNEFDRASNIFHLLKKVYSPCPSLNNVAPLVNEKWFKHITNNVATNHWAKSNTPLQPSPYLNIDMDSDQYSFLNPTMRDVILSTLEQDSFGENAKKKRARRRMCMVDGSAASYSKQLNSPARMEKFVDQNFLVAMMAEMRLEKDNYKKKAKEKKEEEDKRKERNKLAKDLEREQNKRNEMPGIENDIQLGLEHVLKKTVPELVLILDYYYNEDRKKLNKMKRAGVVTRITARMTDDVVHNGCTTTTGNNNIENIAL